MKVVKLLDLREQNITNYDQGNKVQIKEMMGTITFNTEITFQGQVNAVMIVQKPFENMLGKIICIYVYQKLRTAPNIFIVNKYSY